MAVNDCSCRSLGGFIHIHVSGRVEEEEEERHGGVVHRLILVYVRPRGRGEHGLPSS